MLQLLFERLIEHGFEVIKAENESQGLLFALKERPDLILFDSSGGDGLFIFKKLRSKGWGRGIPVIILINSGEMEIVANGLENQVYEFFVKKDWAIEEIVERVEEKLASSSFQGGRLLL